MKQFIRSLLRGLGYDVTRYKPDVFGRDAFQDMAFFLKGVTCPVIFDVGANIGQSVERFKRVLPASRIHSFEPSQTTYALLREHCDGLDGVTTWNYGVGSRQGTLPLIENSLPEMTSFLAPGRFCRGSVTKTTEAKIVTVDAFAAEQGVDFVHILKSDTQGYDFEVFKGAEGLMKDNNIGLIYYEVNFSEMYEGLPSFHEVFRFLSEHDFSLVCVYEQFFRRDLVSWTDALFINREYNRRRVEQAATAE